jgi:hypothetical protein
VNVSLDPAVGTYQSAKALKLFGKRLQTSLHGCTRKRVKHYLSTLHHVHLLHFSLGFSTTFRKMPSCLGHTVNTMPTRSQGAGTRTVYSRVAVQGSSVGLKDDKLKFEKCVLILQCIVTFQEPPGEESITEQDSAGKGGINKIGRIMHTKHSKTKGDNWLWLPKQYLVLCTMPKYVLLPLVHSILLLQCLHLPTNDGIIHVFWYMY